MRAEAALRRKKIEKNVGIPECVRAGIFYCFASISATHFIMHMPQVMIPFYALYIYSRTPGQCVETPVPQKVGGVSTASSWY